MRREKKNLVVIPMEEVEYNLDIDRSRRACKNEMKCGYVHGVFGILSSQILSL